MMVFIAFLAGIAVSAIAFYLPHAREKESSMDNFESFQQTLSSLALIQKEKHSSKQN